MTHRGVFVTGTDTGVGKTFVAALLVKALKDAGVDVVPMKVVQTGCRKRGDSRSAPDLEFVLRATGLEAGCGEDRLMCPVRLMKPCSPHLSARLEGRKVDIGLIHRSFRRLARIHEFVVVEGAGGAMVPLTRSVMMADVMKLLGLPVLVVARPGLGTLNHTLLTIRELRRRSIRVLGIVFNETTRTRRSYLEKDNARTLEECGNVPVLGWVSYSRGLTLGRGLRRRFPVAVPREMRKVLKHFVEAG